MRASTKAKTEHAKSKAASKKRAASTRRLRIERFVKEYLIDLNGKEAAIRAGYDPKYATVIASKLLAQPAVRVRVEAAQAELAAKIGATAEDVARRLWMLATADPNDLIQHQRTCCRYCWGKDHRYQRTIRELERDRADFEYIVAAKRRELEEKDTEPSIARRVLGIAGVDVFDDRGGIGWDPRRDANPDCPECFGEGVPSVVVADTRDLPPAAKLLYAGTEQTKDGLKIKMHDQQAALLQYARHIGMFPTRLKAASGVDGRDDDDIVPVVILSPKRPYEAGK
jgi:hypothetical protein